ncbi:3'(2'), 5'-bisphosphate nucleotidase [Monoraphidium neglectum]|uniref:3'(2'),5'-bisphosphate nucleotidase n=1 Tax=Monoraphidium neglectum TaxID=145388 RepID=A0A0D2MN44_9CHLO|nr:3'(2'), 5'-bisphosphate nucleotidase [Monoraphidium neglectum]KIZ01992.1 3'(2'), 5'-bisphosphate nucleotidase [Monoraphidium neglectum]|eukprot:XP_013901011.1 3'(2'), 5'-bisphosphate nucleotidase [Monoraphidium neglectum]
MLCRIVQQQLSDAEKVDKQDDSPVTVADYGAQVLVAWALSRVDPDTRLSMVAEEDSASLKDPSGAAMLQRITDIVNSVVVEAGGEPLTGDDVIALIDLGQSAGGPAGRHWVLDPIDGTRGFVGMRQYAVCLGMLQDGEVELGVLGCPNLPQDLITDEDGGAAAASRSGEAGRGCLFLAHRGAGAYAADLWDAAAPLQRIRVNDVADNSGARFMESFESRHSDHSFTGQVARLMGVTLPPLRMDSQVKYGLLSRGDASIFMRFPPPSYREKIWDHCAGFVIVEEAGGRVTDAGGARLDFSRGRWLDLDRGIVAGPPRAHAALLTAVAAAEAARAAAGAGSSGS